MRLSLLLFTLFLPFWLSASEPQGRYAFRSYGAEQGLTHSHIWDICQDEQGFLWVATAGGLFRYDGQRFALLDSRNGLPSDYVRSLLSDGERLWVGTLGGLGLYSQGQIRIVEGLPKTEILGMCKDRKGQIWVASQAGLYGVKLEASSPKAHQEHRLPAGFSPRTVQASQSGLWIVGDTHLFHIDPIQSRLVEIQGPWKERLEGLVIDKENRLWVRSHRHLWRSEPLTQPNPQEAIRFEDFASRLPAEPFLDGHLSLDARGALWVPTSKGLVRIQGEQWSLLNQDRGLPSAWVNRAFLDREGNLWVASLGLHRMKGLGAWTYFSTREGLPADTIRSLLRDRQGDLWVGTTGGLARAGQTKFNFLPECETSAILALAQTQDGCLWMGGAPPKLRRYDPRLRHTETILTPDSTITSLQFLRNEDLLVGTRRAGLLRLTKGSKTASSVEWPCPGDRKRVNALFSRDSERVWIAGDMGLVRLEKEAWTVFSTASGLRHPHVRSVLETPQGELWVAYFGEPGLERFTIQGKRLISLEYLDQSSGLVSNTLSGLWLDVQGHLWISTGLGVHRLKSGKLEHFGTGEGLPVADASDCAHLADGNGEVWVGTAGGLARFQPELMAQRATPTAPLVSITAGSNTWKAPFSQAAGILPFAWNTVEFRFAGLSFFNESKIHHQVRLEGLENAWRSTDVWQARYTDLRPGTYTFQVRACQDSGPWGPHSEYKFLIQPAWWQTWWFRTLVFLALATLLVYYIRWRLNRLKRRNQELEAIVAQRTRELVRANAFKSMFLANTSHEIRTPLNAILGLSRLLTEARLPDMDRLQFARTIQRSADGLLHILNDILDLSKIEAGRLEMEAIPFDLRQIMEDALLLVAERAQGKGLDLIGIVEPSLPRNLVGDPNRFRQALLNLLGNAIKFTSRGYVLCRIQMLEALQDQITLKVEVQDTGVGIPPEALGRLFQAYHQADASTSRHFGGTGLGLFITRQLATMMGGEAGAESKEGEGSTIWFTARLALAPAQDDPPPQWLSGRQVRCLDCSKLVEELLGQLVASAGGSLGEPADLWIAGSLQALRHCPETAQKLVLLPLNSPWDEAHALGAMVLHHPIGERAWSQVLQLLFGTRQLSPEESLPQEGRQYQGRILVADDNPGNHLLAEALLKRHGLKVSRAMNGREALEALHRESFDLVFLDGRMPELDGLATAAAIRSWEKSLGRNALPLVALTGSVLPTERQRFLDGGFDAFLPKPLQPEALVNILETYLGQGSPSQKTPEPSPSPSGILDTEHLKALTESLGGPEGLADMVDYFLEDAPSRRDELQRAKERRDREALRTLAHDFKSNAGNLGLKRLQRHCAELEQHAEDWSWADITHSLDELASLTEESRRAVQPYASTPIDPP